MFINLDLVENGHQLRQEIQNLVILMSVTEKEILEYFLESSHKIKSKQRVQLNNQWGQK